LVNLTGSNQKKKQINGYFYGDQQNVFVEDITAL